MDILIQALGLILSLSLLVIIHEGGHFFFAKLFNTRVEKFYLFFNPKFSLVKFKKGETEYGIGWIPLGGYVKISGMIDESMDKSQMKSPPQPWEFRSKPAWQRFFIMTGGVLANFVAAILIFVFILFFNGKEIFPTENLKNGVVWDSLALAQGLENGDKVLKIGGEPVETFNDINKMIVNDKPGTITVERNGNLKTISLPDNFVQQIMAHQAIPIAMPAVPSVIDTLLHGHPAYKAGLQENDTIIQINNEKALYYSQIVKHIRQHANDTVLVGVKRNGEILQLPVNVSKEGKIGIGFTPWIEFIESEKITYGFFESFPAGVNYFSEVLVGYVDQLDLIFTREGMRQVGSFGTIGSLFPKSWNWLMFWHTTAFISIILAVVNILPIPALDGGHLAFLAYEIVTRRKPSQKVMEVAQIIGMILLFALLMLAISNDIRRFLL
jgi:regulator of sigma E protease